MSGASKPLGWLPGTLVAAGLFFLAAGVLSGGPDLVGGIVFGRVFGRCGGNPLSVYPGGGRDAVEGRGRRSRWRTGHGARHR
jgi:hypothetical protein